MLKRLLVLILFFSSCISAYGADTFIVRFLGNKYTVMAPTSLVEKKISVIIENKSLQDLRGRLVNESGEILKHLSIPRDKKSSNEVAVRSHSKLFFVPLSPPFQEVELKIGEKYYEIPPKK